MEEQTAPWVDPFLVSLIASLLSRWSTVTNEPVVVGDGFFITNPIVSQRFDRLIGR
jgi:hypothetical protein